MLHGRNVTSLGPAGRSRLGLGRSFQRVELFSSLTVRENVALGREASLAGANPARQLVSSTAQRATVRRAVEDAMDLTGIGPLADLQAGLLPTGQRRMVELARVLAGPFDLLLLDEPSRASMPARRGASGRSCPARSSSVTSASFWSSTTWPWCVRSASTSTCSTSGSWSSRARRPPCWPARSYATPISVRRVAWPTPSRVRPVSLWSRQSEQAMLELEGVTAGYGETVVLRDVLPLRPRLGGRGAARPQRRGQDHDPARRLRPDQADAWPGAARRGGGDGAQALCHGPTGSVPPARRPRDLPLAHGQGEPRPELAQGQGEGERGEGG